MARRPYSHTLRKEVLTILAERIARIAPTQMKAAKLLGISQPRVSALLRGRVEDFSLDMLVNLSARAGLTVRVDVSRPYRGR
jgi:predicted XRE-type DNA-binding protein